MLRMLTDRCLCGFLLVLASVGTVEQQTLAQEATPRKFSSEDVGFFEKDVLPILKANCFKCHGGEPRVKGELRLTSREGVLKGGEIGPVVNLDKPEDSLLVQAINYGDLKMPPTGKLSAEKIAVLTKWVRLGLPWSSTVEYGVKPEAVAEVTTKDNTYWAYQPVRRPVAPSVKNATWLANPIDAFVLSKLEAAKLAPSSPGEKRALIRRLSYDLTGLPPSPAQVESFVQDAAPQAYERLIDSLLESPRYGEKWGRTWLDLVRYAETHGYERDSSKPEAWRYRDYVIDSFNADKPYDRFLIEQLAGDELDAVSQETLTATGYYRLGIWDDEPADRLQARYDGLDDIVRTTSEVTLAMTLGCARCHDHKGDPLKQTEYYGFLAYFHDVTHMNRENIRRWANKDDQVTLQKTLAERQAREEQIKGDIRSLEEQLKAAQLKTNPETATPDSNAGDDAKDERGILMADSRQDGKTWKYTTTKPSDDWMQPDYSETSWDEGVGGFGQRNTPGAVVRTKWNTENIWMRRSFEVKGRVPRNVSLDIHYDEDCEVYFNGKKVFEAKGFLTNYARVGLPASAAVALQRGQNIIAVHCQQRGGGQYIDVGVMAGAAMVDVAQSIKSEGPKLIGAAAVARYLALTKELEEGRKAKAPEAGTPIMAVTESGRAPTHLLIRGNPHSKGAAVAPVTPAALQVAAPKLIDKPRADGSSGKRLAFAQWLTSPQNPLTARVMMNRLWQQHFGRGIVPTPNDFGQLGEQPTHPELLDWLASEFVAGGWKLKRMHKLMLMSNTYRQRADGQGTRGTGLADPHTADPGNSLLWRFPARRLTAEEVRDSMLFVTSELNLKAGGPSIYVPIPAEVLAGQSNPGSGWGKSPPEEANRRSVYIHVKRSLLVPLLAMHDQADTDSSCPVRYVTTVPTQSLGMLNGAFTNEKAMKFAERLERDAGADRRAQVRLAIALTTSRTATDNEVQSDVAFIEKLQQEKKVAASEALRLYCLLMLNTNEFIYVD